MAVLGSVALPLRLTAAPVPDGLVCARVGGGCIRGRGVEEVDRELLTVRRPVILACQGVKTLKVASYEVVVMALGGSAEAERDHGVAGAHEVVRHAPWDWCRITSRSVSLVNRSVRQVPPETVAVMLPTTEPSLRMCSLKLPAIVTVGVCASAAPGVRPASSAPASRRKAVRARRRRGNRMASPVTGKPPRRVLRPVRGASCGGGGGGESRAREAGNPPTRQPAVHRRGGPRHNAVWCCFMSHDLFSDLFLCVRRGYRGSGST